MYSSAMAKSGPKTERPLDDMRQRCYTVDELTDRKLDAIGKGNRSRGVREAARLAFELIQKGEPEDARN